NTWKLVGLNIAMGPSYSNQGMSRQPYTYPNDGGYNHGYIADLTEYQSQLVPEPATVSLLGMGGLALLIRRRRRRTV
ncbi:MAG: PEP-CTERM sorting domain-containing protein, partial [Phycisphaerae bacterium]|nr:PEP-CTERM sorting domain-containing protein [Phycisphaerae bacterium]